MKHLMKNPGSVTSYLVVSGDFKPAFLIGCPT